MHTIEPFYGWLHLYSQDQDANNPFHETVHSEFFYDRQIYEYLAHPQWDTIESESLLVKILYADYETGYAIIELIGEWNDLYEHDFRLLCVNCLTYLADAGVSRFILISENVFNVYLQDDDYYAAMTEELEDGWICLFRARPHVLDEFQRYGLGAYLYWNMEFDAVVWRKMMPWNMYRLIQNRIGHSLK